ncbi:MAG: hypothetical protein A2268_10285 [Candidatus Raymondbacteria bacterium RifOxyA12_full_50_37]|uniref:Uncharacterized protein n=1 Tax=Candidatus Raymondbacteria bacterium RIFOXYD12_FULL_49_13 TaxID=1817890 RepID=A0A1F7FK98_UNCRA|nr:MAG: hypothetical protein A2268_10285 [Candidatus Raymondbacteria bacterium RifOxyA12_full_50_37]OGJ90151.1 MAG: hypothetical protein A2248_16765 [Candidatus Raymondbacteria bacterium RIFOXYA2_FULL_49_16]OGJ97222.1 MAG: hypothetical protein A2453_01255 [Candidatus Raymondbacteria bacterium RIFOXYC2_FULL_50_21]OGK04490.1 MAG: hypothetical protein A2350_15295 [Candidatus Raymondbacteria bacterium RifOxyB12_full_50_8]OGK07145.1 MAG: hypothetical protein A2519_09335 [Candidatus Raymondbacteria b
MPFVRVSGISGLVFEPPTEQRKRKKHICTDCFLCQWCSDERCALCLKRRVCERQGKKKK